MRLRSHAAIGVFCVIFLQASLAQKQPIESSVPGDPGKTVDGTALAACKKLGKIQVGPSASGEAVRILSTAYTLRPLRGNVCKACLGIVVGPADLFNSSIIDQLRAAYEAGHGVALTNATHAGIERLHDLLGHRGSAQPAPGVASADLVAFRKAFRADGQLHSSSHILLPRTTAAGTCVLTKSNEDRRRQRIADANDIKALQRIFSATPVVPGEPPGNAQQNIVGLAESYESRGIQSDSNGDQVQMTNSIWAARSFSKSSDYYYVNQEVDYAVNAEIGTLKSWSNTADAQIAYPGVFLVQPSPQTTREATLVTSGVSQSIGVSAGFNTSGGVDASVTTTKTISNSSSTPVPAIDIINAASFTDALPQWTYVVDDLNALGDIDLYNNWIWQVPFSSYTGSSLQGQLVANYSAGLTATIGSAPVALVVNLESHVPWPFGQTFQIQPPMVTGVSPGCVDSGNSFTIHGSGLYPSLVQAVLINGNAVEPQNITTVSDTQLNVIAPDIFDCHFGCPVEVQTNKGTSNTDFNIEISALCGG